MEHEQIQQRNGIIKDGLKQICRTYLNFHLRQNIKGKYIEQIQNLQSIQLGDEEQQFFFNINSAVLIQWLIESLQTQLGRGLINEQSKNVLFTILRMVQTSKLVKAQTLMPNISSQHSQNFSLMFRDCHSQYCVQSVKVSSQKQQCSILSQNIKKIKQIILSQRQQIRQTASKLLNKVLWIDLNTLFLNALLNLKRGLKKINDDMINKNQINAQHLKRLKLAQLYIHYLWITNFTRTQSFIKNIKQPDCQERKYTYIYLLYEKQGCLKISSYCQQGSFIQIKKQIDFLYRKIEEVIS